MVLPQARRTGGQEFALGYIKADIIHSTDLCPVRLSRKFFDQMADANRRGCHNILRA
ncbi:MAG: hypothetical protein R2865_02835 [Deinococcales bacterium]